MVAPGRSGCTATSRAASQPTTDLVLSHKHPDDYGQVAATLDEIRRTSGAFSTRHRIIDTHGEIHHVVVVGDQLFDDAGAVIGTHGFYVDVTPSMQQRHDQIVTEAVAEIAEARGVIEQAKGMLMVIYRISADSAFELLKWRSQETNTKLRALAEQIARDFLELRYDEELPPRSAYDRLLLTAHTASRPEVYPPGPPGILPSPPPANDFGRVRPCIRVLSVCAKMTPTSATPCASARSSP